MSHVTKFLRCTFRRVARLPYRIQIETTNRCNLTCAVCPRQRMGLPERDLPLATYEAILDRLDGVRELNLTGWGEPLLHPELVQMIDLAKQKLPAAKMRFTTNGVLLTPETTDRLLAAGLDDLAVSIDEVSSRGTEYHGHEPQQLVRENVKYLCRQKPKGFTVSLYCLMCGRVEAIEELIDFAAEAGVDAFQLIRIEREDDDTPRPTWQQERELIQAAKRKVAQTRMKFVCLNDQGPLLRLAGHHDTWCLKIDDYAYVDIDGNVTPCCSLRDYRAGNLLESSLAEIWHGPAFQRFRAEQGRICGRCDALKHRYHGGACRSQIVVGVAVGKAGERPSKFPTKFSIRLLCRLSQTEFTTQSRQAAGCRRSPRGPVLTVPRVIESFLPCVTGPANEAFRISQELERRGISSPVLTTYCDVDPRLPAKEELEGVTVQRFRNQWRAMRYCVSVRMASAFQNFDILHAHNYRSFPSDLGCLMAKLRHRPFVLSAHGSLLGYSHYLSSASARLPYALYDTLTLKAAARAADLIVVSLKDEYEDAIRFGIDRKRIAVIPMGIDVDQYPTRTRAPHEELRLLFVGRIARNRNLEPLIDAMAHLTNARLTIVGGEVKCAGTAKGHYLPELRGRAQGLGPKVQFLGPKYGDELRQCYGEADVFAYTSRYESCGHTLLEAAAAGLPIVSTPVGLAKEIVVDGETGFLVDTDPRAIAERVDRLREHKTRAEMGARLRGIVKQRFAWEPIIDQYVEAYNRLLR